MLRKLWLPAVMAICLLFSGTVARATQMEIYGAWHCSNDFCTWATVRNMTNFDTANHWMIDRGDGTPSVNLVVLSFVNPLRAQLGSNAANLAKQLGVGIEIDYENNTSPNLSALQSFINAYRAILPYDASGANPAARLTIDLAAGDQYLVPLAAKATTEWLNTSAPVLDYANAMVPNKQPNSASSAESNWQQHISGYPRITPPVPPLAPAKMAGSLYIVTGKNPAPECTTFSSSLENSTGTYVETVAPAGAGSTPGMLKLMFWAAECQGAHSICTTPPNTCQGGVGVGSKTYSIPFPMPALRQN